VERGFFSSANDWRISRWVYTWEWDGVSSIRVGPRTLVARRIDGVPFMDRRVKIKA
jgi:hypothetical protein